MLPGINEVLRDARVTLRASLAGCVTPAGAVDVIRFDEFRHRLIWMITVEQRVLLPRLVARLGTLAFQKGMQRDHIDLITLCVASPNAEWVENLSQLLENHLELEEGRGGLLELVGKHLADAPDLVDAVGRLPWPRLPPFEAGSAVREQVRGVLVEAGLAEPPVQRVE